MLIINVANGNTISQTAMGKVEQFGNLTWSPNGNDIAFSGMVEGQSDIFSYNLSTKALTQITNDEYSDYAPSFSPDGNSIVFSSDRASMVSGNISAVNPINLTIYNLISKTLTNVPVFPGANNLNAQFSGDSKRIFFLSNRDGFRNLYEFNLVDNSVKQLTDYFTGISGITEFSPAITVSRNDDIVYSYYRYQRYTLYNSALSNFKSKTVNAQEVNFDAAILPPMENVGVNIVNSNLGNFERFEKTTTDSLKTIPYKPKFRLDYLANSGVGVSTSRFGTGIQGGIMAMFSDILGRNQIIANLSVNGEISDFGGLVGYINQQSRINWGVGVSHIPYTTGFRSFGIYQGAANAQPLDTVSTNILRTFEDKLEVFGSYPFSKIHRFEAGGAFSYYSYRLDRFNNFYASGNYPFGYVGSNREKVSTANATNLLGIPLKPFSIWQTNASFIGDNSIFGLTAPLDGFRYRIGAEQYFGDFNFTAITADVRKYFRAKPVTFAVRAYNYMRLGKDGENLFPLYVGYPYLIRGYDANSFYSSKRVNSGTFDINQLSGSKLAVFNFEVRLPFTGPKKLAQIPSRFLFSDLNLFFDAGLAWTEDSYVSFKNQPNGVLLANGTPIERVPALSAGISMRVNVFGYFIIEPYYAIPFQRKDVNVGVFGLTFAPGW
jgi:hypothetical protein